MTCQYDLAGLVTGTAATVCFLHGRHGMRFQPGGFRTRQIRTRLPDKRGEHERAAKNGEQLPHSCT